LEEKLLEKSRFRDDRAMEMIEIEKDLVNILCEQQKVVLSLVQQSDKGQGSDAQRVCERLVKEARIPWPPPGMIIIVRYFSTPLRKYSIIISGICLPCLFIFTIDVYPNNDASLHSHTILTYTSLSFSITYKSIPV